MTIFAILRLNGGKSVARVDWAHERIRSLDGDDLGNLRDIEQRGDARRGIFSESGRRQKQMRVGRRQTRGQSGEVLRSLRGEVRRVGVQDLGHTGNPGGFLRCAAGVWPATSTCMSPPTFCAAAMV
jgi:hypothetical protein